MSTASFTTSTGLELTGNPRCRVVLFVGEKISLSGNGGVTITKESGAAEVTIEGSELTPVTAGFFVATLQSPVARVQQTFVVLGSGALSSPYLGGTGHGNVRQIIRAVCSDPRCTPESLAAALAVRRDGFSPELIGLTQNEGMQLENFGWSPLPTSQLTR